MLNKEGETRNQFIQFQQSIGINRQNFKQKFVFLPHNLTDNILVQRFYASPSQLHGFTLQQQKYCSFLLGQFIFKACQSLKLPVSTAIVSASIAHFYYSRVSFMNYDLRDIAMGSVFLACKSEQCLRKSYEIAAVFDYIFKIFEGQRKPIKILDLNSRQYQYIRNKILQTQKDILFQLGFEVYKLLQIPHRYIRGLFQIFDKFKDVTQQAWKYLNDFYKTNMCIFYPGQVIAAASFYKSCTNKKMPIVAWWTLMQASIDSIQQLISQLQFLYESAKQSKYIVQNISNIMERVGQLNKIQNVFPFKYNKKIQLDLNGQLRINIKKIQENNNQIKIVQKIEQQINEIKIQKIDYQQKKKKKDKKKKQKKDKKKKDKKSKKNKQKQKKKKKNSERQSSSSRSYSKSQQNQMKKQKQLQVSQSNESKQRQIQLIQQKNKTYNTQQIANFKNSLKQSTKQFIERTKNKLNLMKRIQNCKPAITQQKDDSQQDLDEDQIKYLRQKINNNKKTN